MTSEDFSMSIFNRFSKVLTGLLAVFLLTSCSKDTEQLVVYSGRSQVLVEQLVEEFKAETGIDIAVRYGNDAELLAVLNEEGDKSPADLFWANTTGAIATASEQGLLKTLPDSLLSKPDNFTSSSDEWVPVTVRFRVLAYNPNTVDVDDLPSSVMDLPDLTQFKGRIGWTPTYSSFYDFLTTMRFEKGDDVARQWLNEMQQLDPKSYSSNTPMVQAVAAGEIDIALTNHYYVLRLKFGGGEGEYENEVYYIKHEANPDASIATYHFENGDLGNLALVTGAAELKTSHNSEAAQRFLSFLLSKQAQEFAAESVHEYPVINEVELPEYMLREGKAFKLSPEYNFENLKKLEGTLDLLRQVGVI